MVFRKFRPVKQWGKMDTRIFKEILNSRNERRMPAFQVPEALKSMGVPIFDPNDPNFPQCVQDVKQGDSSENRQLTHPAFRPAVHEDHPLYKTVRCLLFEGVNAQSDGMAQACAISKAVLREEFPKEIVQQADTVDISEEKIRDSVLHGEKYDPTLEKLPIRFDPVMFWIKHPRVHGTPVVKRNNIILNNLYRHVLLNSIAKKGVRADQYRCDRNDPLSALVSSSPFFSENPLVLRFQPYMTVQSTVPKKNWASQEEIDAANSESVSDISPLSPIIDLDKEHIYNDGALMARQHSDLSIDTILWSREQDQKYPWTTEQNAANAILHTFGAAVAQATRMGKTNLDKPIITKGVQLCDGKLDMVAFQLNTLDLNPENPVKNIVWVERAARLYSPKPYYEQLNEVPNVNMETFKKFAALLMS